MKTKLCIFDLDGTLVNSLYDLADAMNYSLKKNGLPTHERDKYRYMVGNGITVLADRAMVVPDNTDPALKEKVLADFNSYYRPHCMDCTRPYNGIPELLDELDKMGIAYSVLSNKPDHFTNLIVSTLFKGRKFAVIRGTREGCPRKPEPDAALEIIKEVGVNSEEVLYIGDTNVDMKTAENAGLKKIGVSWGFRPVSELIEAKADYIVDTPSDILQIISQKNKKNPL